MLQIRLNSVKNCDRDMYTSFLLKEARSLIYYSLDYLEFVENITGSKCLILIATQDNHIKGIFPFFRKDTPIGIVINSSPFYGSHGGCLAEDESIEVELIKYFTNYCGTENILSATIIPPFFKKGAENYIKLFKPDFNSIRYYQCKSLPLVSNQNVNQDLDNVLLESIPSKTRNMIRKPIKAGVSFCVDNSVEGIDFLSSIHEQNCLAIGISAKEKSFFQGIKKFLIVNEDFKIYLASVDGQKIAALLCLYHNKTVEYFVPAIVESHRSLQPLSLLIFEAMKDAISRGYRYWNWGGTSTSAENVFRFKDSWGTENGEYNYYTRVFNQDVFSLSRKDIEKYMKYYFVIDYNKINE